MHRKTRYLLLVVLIIAVALGAFQVGPQAAVKAAGGGVQANSSIVVSGSAPADNVSPVTVTVTIRNASNNPEVGDQITFAPSATPAGVTFNPGSPFQAFTDAAGQATLTMTSTAATSFTVTAFDSTSGPFALGPVTVTFTSPPASAGNSTVSANPLTVEANGIATSTISVIVRNAGNLPIPGKAVTLATVPPGATGVTITGPNPLLTDGTGLTTFTVKRSGAIGSVTFQASVPADGVTITQTATVNFTAPLPSASTSSVQTTGPASVPADNSTTSQVKVTVRDAGSNPMPGLTVSLGATPSTGIGISSASPITNALGEVVFDVKSQYVSSPVTVTFTAVVMVSPLVTINQTSTVTFTTPPASKNNSTVSASATTVPADNTTPATITVTLLDAGFQPAPNKVVSLAAAPSAGVSITGGGATNASGQVQFSVRSSVAATVTFTATDQTDLITLNNPGQPQVITFTVAPTSPTASTVQRIPATGTVPGDGTTTVTIRVTLKDAGGNLLPGRTVGLTANPAAGVTIAPVGSTTSDANGIVNFTASAVASTAPLTVTFTAQDTSGPGAPVTLSQQPVVVFAIPPASATASSVTCSPVATPPNCSVLATGLPGDAATITVTVRDQNNHLLDGKVVQLVPSSSGGLNITPNAGSPSLGQGTTVGGVVTFTVTSTTVYQPTGVTFTARVVTDSNLQLAQQPIVVFASPPAVPGNSTIAAAPTSIPADNTTTSTITVTLHDAANNPSVGKLLQLTPATPDTGITITPNGGNPLIGVAATGAGGIATFTVKSSVAYAGKVFTVNDVTDGIATFLTVPVTFTPSSSGIVSGTTSTIAVSSQTLGIGAPVTLTVVLKDASGAPVVGFNPTGLTVGVSPTFPVGVTIGPASGASDSAGQITYQISTTAAGTGGPWTLTATVPAAGAFIANPPAGGTNQITSITGPLPPTIVTQPASVTIVSGTSTTLSVVATGTSPLTYQWYQGPSGTTTTPVGTNSASFTTPALTVTTDYWVLVSNVAAPAGVPSATATVTVSGGATPPVITSAASATWVVGTNNSFPVTASGTAPITFGLTGQPAFVTIIAATGVMSGNPAAGDVGTHVFTVTATNSAGSAPPQTFTLTVTLASAAPTITSAATATFTAGVAGTFTVTATGSPSPTFSLTGAPAWLTINATTGVMSGTPPAAGTFTFTVTAANGISPNATQNFTLTVNPGAGTAPTITSAATATFTAGVAGTFTVTATGSPAPTFSLTGAPAWLTINATTGVMSGTPPAAGTFTFTVTAANGTPPNATQNFTLTVNPGAGTPPTITTQPASVTINSGQSANLSVVATGTGLTYQWYQGASPSTASPVAGATAATFNTGPLTASTSYWVQVSGTAGPPANSNTAVVTVIPGVPDLAIAASPTTATFTQNVQGQYNITISNAAGTAPGGPPVAVFSTLQGGMTLASFSGTGWTCTGAGTAAVSCSYSSTIPAGLNTVLSILVNTPTTGNVTNSFTVSPVAGETNMANNTVSVPIQVNAGTGGTPGVTSGTNSTLICDFLSIPADGKATATCTVTLRDGSNNPVPNKNVVLTATPTLAGVTPPTPVGSTLSDAAGQVRFTIKSTVQGSITLQASDTSSSPVVFLTQTAQLSFTAPGTAPVANPAAAAAAAGTGGATAVAVPSGPTTGIVRAFLLRVRTGPGLEFPIIGLLRQQTQVLILAKNSRGTWYQIKLDTGTAWVSALWVRVTRAGFNGLPVVDMPGTAPLQPIPPPLIPRAGEGVGSVTAFRLRVRSGPGTNYRQIGSLQLRTQVLLIGRSPDRGWFQIRIQGGTAWISARWVRVLRINGVVLPTVPAPPVN